MVIPIHLQAYNSFFSSLPLLTALRSKIKMREKCENKLRGDYNASAITFHLKTFFLLLLPPLALSFYFELKKNKNVCNYPDGGHHVQTVEKK